MVTIETTCPSCGAVECAPEDFELALCSHQPLSYYAFVCPVCLEHVQKPATEKAVELLIAEGVTPRYWRVPAEMEETHAGPPLTVDDLIAFHELLEGDGWFTTLLQSDSASDG